MLIWPIYHDVFSEIYELLFSSCGEKVIDWFYALQNWLAKLVFRTKNHLHRQKTRRFANRWLLCFVCWSFSFFRLELEFSAFFSCINYKLTKIYVSCLCFIFVFSLRHVSTNEAKELSVSSRQLSFFIFTVLNNGLDTFLQFWVSPTCVRFCSLQVHLKPKV